MLMSIAQNVPLVYFHYLIDYNSYEKSIYNQLFLPVLPMPAEQCIHMGGPNG